MALEFTDSNFEADVLQSDQLTVVDFWAEWCGPCRAISPVIEELSKQYNGKVKVGKLNIDHNPSVGINYGITSIPAILFIKDGKVVDKQMGAAPKSILEKKIQLHM
jgi:thioredoxin 1